VNGHIGAWFEATTPANLTPDQQAALHIWTRYWQITMEAYNTYGTNLSTAESVKAFNAVAKGKARDNTARGIEWRADRKLITVGPTTRTVAAVDISDGRAIVRGCVIDKSYEVNHDGKIIVPAPVSRPLADVLVRYGNGWVVQDTPFLNGTCTT
jgi:hypothetical protein